MLDCLIRGATVVDGTGQPASKADIGIRGGRVVAVGAVEDAAKDVIDAGGLVVCPGFLDVHTHFDAQVLWDQRCTPSPLHGVTTVIAGNCGFGLAPAGPQHAQYLFPMLSRVEGIPLESLQTLDWSWETTGEYYDRIEGGLAVNMGFLTGHSTIRRASMGERSVGGIATEDDMLVMENLLRESLAAGSLGFSSSNAGTHTDGAGDPVPSRWANEIELLRLCRVVGEFPGTTLEYIPARAADEAARMAALSREAQRPLNWNILLVSTANADGYKADLESCAYASRVGARVAALTPPGVVELFVTFRTGFMLDVLPGWSEILKLPIPERLQALAHPDVRARMRSGAVSAGARRKEMTHWAECRIVETHAPHLAELAGKTVGTVAAERGGIDPLDALLDVVIEDDLHTLLLPLPTGADEGSWIDRRDVWRNENVLLGASDAGAHVDILATYGFATKMLAESVRERGYFSLEEAIHLLTYKAASFYGLRDRGRISEGCWADLVMFDPDRIAAGPVTTRHDLPGGARRLYTEGIGIEAVFVNGTQIVHQGALTDVRPGRLLRSGADTRTVPIA